MSKGTWAGAILVKISDCDDLTFFDWIRGGTLSSIIDDPTLA